MKKIGIIVEYNPMHQGHLEHIRQIKKIYPDSLIIAIMSGNVVQRGEFAIYDKFLRTKVGIENGVDLIVELPPYFSLNNANIFANGAIKYLNKFGVEIIVYGSENNNLEQHQKIAKKLSKHKYQEKLSKLQHEYHSLPRAFNELFKDGQLKSNDLLGICYNLESSKINREIQLESIKRDNSKFSSASSIRKKIIQGEHNNDSLILNQNGKSNVIDMNNFFDAIKAKLITTNFTGNNTINYVKNNLESTTKDWYKFIESIANKNFTKAHLSREILKFFLEIDSDLNETPWILGASLRGKNYLKTLDIKYHTKFKKEYQNDLKIAKILGLKDKQFLEKELNEIIFIK